jgi:hypothetical protein
MALKIGQRELTNKVTTVRTPVGHAAYWAVCARATVSRGTSVSTVHQEPVVAPTLCTQNISQGTPKFEERSSPHVATTDAVGSCNKARKRGLADDV